MAAVFLCNHLHAAHLRIQPFTEQIQRTQINPQTQEVRRGMYGARELVQKLGHLDDHCVNLLRGRLVVGDPDLHGFVKLLDNVERRALEDERKRRKEGNVRNLMEMRLFYDRIDTQLPT